VRGAQEQKHIHALGPLKELVSADHATRDPGFLQRRLDVATERAVSKQDGKVVVVDEAAEMGHQVTDGRRDEGRFVRRRGSRMEHDGRAGRVRRRERLVDAFRV
jgi:uncharacterized protein involved in type VI secretion and phage assembly